MTGTKTVAERLRDYAGHKHNSCGELRMIATGAGSCFDIDCSTCRRQIANDLADKIEADQAQAVSKALIEEVAKQENMDSVLLYNAAKDLQENARIIKESVLDDLAYCAGLIRKATKGAKPQLPEGVIWPRYEDGELVKFGDAYVNAQGNTSEVRFMCIKAEGFKIGRGQTRNRWQKWGEPVKRPEPEVLDADGVSIKVGDTLYNDRGIAFRVDHLKSLGNTIKLTCIKECAEFSLDPSTLTHQAPVLDADRVPIKVGDTVWNINNGKKYEVLKLPHKDSYQSVMVRGEDGTDGFDPDRLTHRKPDTQVAIDNDTALPPWEYCERHGIDVAPGTDESDTVEAMCRHLLERQRKLLGGE